MGDYGDMIRIPQLRYAVAATAQFQSPNPAPPLDNTP
jgi:hypothetical protein